MFHTEYDIFRTADHILPEKHTAQMKRLDHQVHDAAAKNRIPGKNSAARQENSVKDPLLAGNDKSTAYIPQTNRKKHSANFCQCRISLI